MTAVLRCLLDSHDEPEGSEVRLLTCLRKLDPLPTPQAEKNFLDAAAAEFWKGMVKESSNHFLLTHFELFLI